MAGIGFELRRLLRKHTLLDLARAYVYAGVIGSGPWVLSIIGILLIGVWSVSVVIPPSLVTQFQTSVTYLVAGSLIYTGLAQLTFTRYIADRLFEKRRDQVLPNLHGVMLLVLLGAAAVGVAVLFLFLRDLSVAYQVLMLAGFMSLSGVWVLTILLSGLKQYNAVVAFFAIAYALIVLCSLLLRPWGLEGLLAGFVFGHYVLLFGMWTLVAREFRAPRRLISFDFLTRGRFYPSLVAVGLLYNLGIWADKFMFWWYPPTSQQIIGSFRSSLIYDLPVFLAYLSIIPGMAVFLVRIETDFVEFYDRFYDAVRGGGSLQYIQVMRDEMVYAVQQGLGQIAKVQTLAVLMTFLAGPWLLDLLGISRLYLPLLYVQVVGAGLQVGVMAVLNVLFYLDERRAALWLCILFVSTNVALTALTLQLGATFYGYGFAVAQLLTLATGLHILTRRVDQLEYRTFMLQ